MITNAMRTRRWRWAASAAVVAVTGMSAAACSSASSGSGSAGSGSEPQSITFAISNPSGNEHYYQNAAAAYEKAHPGVTITTQVLPAESYAQAITTRIEGGNAPDVFEAELAIARRLGFRTPSARSRRTTACSGPCGRRLPPGGRGTG